MRIPTQLVIGPYVFSVQLKRKPHVKDKLAWGFIDMDDQRIVLRKDCTDDRLREVLLHEVIHGIDNTRMIGLDEEQVLHLATGLTETLLNNPSLAAMFTEGTDGTTDSGDAG